MENILEDLGHTILHRNEGTGTSYTEYHTHLSEKELEMLTSQILAQAHDVFQRALDLDQIIRYVQQYLLARA